MYKSVYLYLLISTFSKPYLEYSRKFYFITKSIIVYTFFNISLSSSDATNKKIIHQTNRTNCDASCKYKRQVKGINS